MNIDLRLSTVGPDAMTIEEWFSQKDKFRVVAKGFPMLTLEPGILNPLILNHYNKTVSPFVPEILEKYNIKKAAHDLDFRYPRDEKHKGQYTLAVMIFETETSSWPSAAAELLNLMEKSDFQKIDCTIQTQVELYNPDKFYCDVSLPLPDDAELLSILTEIRKPILDIVRKYLEGAWSSIAFHLRKRRDRKYYKDIDPARPTVLVFCRPGVTSNFGLAEAEIEKILDRTTRKIYLELLPGEILEMRNTEGTAPQSFPQRPLNGASIGIQECKDRAGTLGGWVYLNHPKYKTPFRCALTCYHVVRSKNDAVAKVTDRDGVNFENSTSGQVTVEYPARCDATSHLNLLDEMLQENPTDPNLGRQRADLMSLMDDPGIGQVILASGRAKTKEYKHRLDWALILSTTTFSRNRAPSLPLSQFPVAKSFFKYSLNHDLKVRDFGRLTPGDWVLKNGRTTNVTFGVVNRIERTVNWDSGEISLETEAMAEGRFWNFAQPGDSGSLVTNTKGELVGLLSGRDTHSGHEIGIVTPIEKIQQHVKEMTDGGFLSLD